MPSWFYRYGWLFGWLLLVVVSYLVRSLLPIDETRYVSVAWEMWQRGDFLVPHINGEPYSHKPPFMFWLFHAGWAVFGVNDWWPRVAPALFSLAGLFLARRMAVSLWPDRPRVALLAPWILASCLYWALFTPATMFDMLLAGMVMLAMIGLLRASDGRMFSGWLLVGVATGLGILVKGPVMVLHLALPALLAPWWSERARQAVWRWYGALLAAIALGAAIALAWALPAAAAGGPAYEQAILWHQTADRMVTSFAHRRPVWWYLPLLPLLLAPWLIWPPLWKAFARLKSAGDAKARFLLAWLVPVVVAFSFVSGKQPHYLLPVFPAFALLAARALDGALPAIRRRDQALPALLFALMGVALLVLPYLPEGRLPTSAAGLSPLWGIALLLLAASLLSKAARQADTAVVPLAQTAVLALAVSLAGLFSVFRPVYDLTPAAQLIADVQERGGVVANVGKYHDQFHFLGRLKQPLVELSPDGLSAWREAHPGGYVVIYHRDPYGPQELGLVYQQPYRGQWLSVWQASRVPLSN